MKVENPVILVVEDDENDRFFIKGAFKKIGAQVPLRIVNNGAEAIAYLNGDGEFSDRGRFPFPTTIITDLKMPVMDGFAVLEHRRRNPQWAIIPTVVLSASTDLDDIKKAVILGAAAYHVKPNTPSELEHQLKVFIDYWRTSEIPQTESSGEMMKTESHGKLGERFQQ